MKEYYFVLKVTLDSHWIENKLIIIIQLCFVVVMVVILQLHNIDRQTTNKK